MKSYIGQRILCVAGGVAEAGTLHAQQTAYARLRAVQMHHLALIQHIASVRGDQAQGFGPLALTVSSVGDRATAKQSGSSSVRMPDWDCF